MEQHLKQRLVGAAVLLGMAVLFIPMVLNNADEPGSTLDKVDIPARPEGFSSRIVPLDQPGKSAMMPGGQRPDLSPAADGSSTQTERLPLEPMAPANKSATSDALAEQTPPVRVGVSAWAVQLGSFASEVNAQALEQRLLKQGYAAFVETIEDAQKKVFRVRIGPELLKSSASKLLKKLEKETKLKGIVVRYP